MNIITLIKISWRNVWRSKLRSFVVIMSVIFGILGGIIMIAMSYGLNEERMNNAVDTYLSHIQIHNKFFSEDYNIIYLLINKVVFGFRYFSDRMRLFVIVMSTSESDISH